MISLEQAVACLTDQVTPIKETEQVSLESLSGRILAQDYTAPFDQPPFPRSPLDGYAVRGEDTTGASHEMPVSLRVIGKVYAGHTFEGEVQPGEAVRIMTGAPIPVGANAVIRQEDTDYGCERVGLYASVKPYQNYCYAGEDFQKGTVLLKKGTVLNAYDMAVLASLGYGSAVVYRQPAIAVISTGDELLQPGQPLTAGKIYDSNRILINSRLQALGIPSALTLHCGDSAEQVAEQIREVSAHCDIIITTGGVSVGEKDIMHGVLKCLGVEPLFWRVAVKPGSPTLTAVYQDTLLICLSGNPYGAAANFELLVRPVLAVLTGNSRLCMKVKTAVLTNAFPKQGKMRRFLRGYTKHREVQAVTGNHSSGALSAMLRCNCLIEIPPEQNGAQEGTQVRVHLL